MLTFAESGLFLDLEVNPLSGKIAQVGAVFGDRRWKVSGAQVRHALEDIGEAAKDAAYLAGHNLLDHDLRVIETALPHSPLLKLPALDTLVVSTLAFPKKPFHALTKDYKQSETDRNNPLFDAERSRSLLSDCLTRLSARREVEADLLHCHATALAGVPPAPQGDDSSRKINAARAGFRKLFAALDIRIPTTTESPHWESFLKGKTCDGATREVLRRLTAANGPDIPLAFATAWLAESGATFPAWASRRFRPMVGLLHRWRGVACEDPSCTFCEEAHSPVHRLREFFEYPDFRPEPEVKDRPGVSLQREIVTLGLRDRSVLGILPTGGGKSLCFQIPALHRHRATGALTVVVSPLQSLMKDQVDNLAKRFGHKNAGALYGGLNPVERKLLLQDIADGSIGLLYLSPEQLRNTPIKNLLKLRNIGAWVFDEAHCLAKWGHDFRPDYLAASKAIREIAEAQGVPVPPIQAYTATAKAEVRDEIVAHFREKLGLGLAVLDGGAERTNLAYRVEVVPESGKAMRIRELLTEHLGEGREGAAVIFCSSRAATEKLAAGLSSGGFSCAHFHAGLDRERKEAIQDEFMRGGVRVIAATNAFGMGVDKEDIRLVVHLDMPGSLENYLQEAGRAGRDGKPAEAVLLYDENTDAERQFDLLDLGRLDKRDLDGILRTVRARAKVAGAAVLSATEIAEALSPTNSFEKLDETAVKAAIAHLERCEFIRRDDNVNRVFQVRPLTTDLSTAYSRIARSTLPDDRKALARAVMATVFDPDLRTPADFLSALQSLADMQPLYETAREKSGGRAPNETRVVLEVLAELCDPALGILKRDLIFSAVVPVANAKNPALSWRRTAAFESRLLALLAETAPDLAGDNHPFDAARLANALSEDSKNPVAASSVAKTLFRWSKDWRRLRPDSGNLTIKLRGDNGVLSADSEVTWPEIKVTLELRAHACGVFAEHLLTKARRARENGDKYPGAHTAKEDALTEFTESELTDLLRADLVIASHNLPAKAIYALTLQALLTLDATFALQLIGGKSVITSAMTLTLHEAARPRYTKGDHEALEKHHEERVSQVHVIAGYARRFARGATEALRMLVEYFVLAKATFIERYFGDNPKQLDLACTLESFQKITRDLSPAQHAVVCEKKERNLMILAGPGSGKTRVIVHRIAFLVKVRRENPARIAVMCYNRHAALELRRRLHELIGPRAAALVVGTYHGLALRLTGRRLSGETPGDDPLDFTQLLEDATLLLEGKATPAGEDDSAFLDRLRGGFTHLFVDEYQDITPAAYRFVAALAGKASEKREVAPQLIAVGDDDQSIYAFNGANADFIRSFERDYDAERACLLENFRSTAAVIDAANTWIAVCPGRMKLEKIRLDSRRAEAPRSDSDRFSERPVRLFLAESPCKDGRFTVARAALDALDRIRSADAKFDPTRCAIISRVHEDLASVRQLLVEAGIPYRMNRDTGTFRLSRERTAWELLAYLRNEQRETLPFAEVFKRLENAPEGPADLLQKLVEEYASTQANDAIASPSALADHLAEALSEMKSGIRRGDGLLLTTAHGAKGLEFDHVIVLDGERWEAPSDPDGVRLLYVAMTRAMRSLSFVAHKDRLSRMFLKIQALALGEISPVRITKPDPAIVLRYETLSLEDYFLGFLGRKESGSVAHRAMKRLRPGDTLALRVTSDGFFHLGPPDAPSVAVAALSKSAREKIRPWVESANIREITVVACVTRLKTDSVPTTNADGLRCDSWEIPVVEIVREVHPDGR